MSSIPRVHVMTFVKHPETKEEELIAHGTLQRPEHGQDNPDYADGQISHTNNFQCDGHASTGGCQELHAHAVERVRARVMNDDGNVNVVWRRFHPKVAGGVAKPGEPFIAKDDLGREVRVEVRKVVDEQEERFDPKAISMVSLMKMQNDLASKKGLADFRMQVRSEFSIFEDTFVAAAREQLEAVVQRLSDLPNQKDVQAAAKESVKQIDALHRGLEKKMIETLAGAQDNNAVNAFKQLLGQEQPKLQGVFAPLKAVEDAAAELLNFQDQVRAQGARIEQLAERLEASRVELPTLAATAGKKERAAAEKAVEALLGKTKKEDAVGKLAELEGELPAVTERVDAAVAALDAAVGAEQAKKDAFAARCARVNDWKADAEQAKADVLDFIEAGGMFAGFAVPYWKKEAEKVLSKAVGDLPEVDGLAYHQDADQKQLDAALKKLGPINTFIEKVNADMKKRNLDGIYQVVEAGGHKFEAPSAKFKVLEMNGGAARVEASVRNNADRPMRLHVRVAGKDVVQLVLGGKDRALKLELPNVKGPISLVVTGVGQAGAVAAGAQAQLTNVTVEGNEVELMAAGQIRHVPPYTFTPAPDQPVGQQATVVEGPNPGWRYLNQQAPGV